MAVIFPLGTSHPPTVVLSRATFGRNDMLPQAQPNGQRQPPPQPQQGFITAAQLANGPQAAKDRASGSGLAASGLSAAATATDGRSAKRQKVSQAQYTYVDLGSLPMHGQENVYGVISEFRMPRKTKGTDYLMNLTLIDPSSSDGSPPVRSLTLCLSQLLYFERACPENHPKCCMRSLGSASQRYAQARQTTHLPVAAPDWPHHTSSSA